MPLTVTVNTIAECLRTDCNILGDKNKLPAYGRRKCSRWCSRRVQFKMQEAGIYEQQISFAGWEGLNLLVDFLFTVWRTKTTDFRKRLSLCVTGSLKTHHQ